MLNHFQGCDEFMSLLARRSHSSWHFFPMYRRGKGVRVTEGADLLQNSCEPSCKSTMFTSSGPPETLWLMLISLASRTIHTPASESVHFSKVKSIRDHRFDLDSLWEARSPLGVAGGRNISRFSASVEPIFSEKNRRIMLLLSFRPGDEATSPCIR